MAFKTYNPKGSPKDGVDVSKEYTAEEIYKDLPSYTKQDKVLIVDGDVIAFRCSTVCETKHSYTHPNGDVYNVKSKGVFKTYCLENDLNFDEFVCANEQIADPLPYCLKTVSESLKRVMEFTNCNKMEIYIGGSDNFRLKVPTPVEYKASRTEVSKPLLLNEVRDYLIKYKGAKKVTTQEADDVVAHRMRTLYKQGIRATLYSCDKDALGNVDHKLQMYDPIKEDIIVSEGGVGSIELVKSKLKGKGLKFLIYQACNGDPVDSYSPKPFFNKKYGDSSFYKDFNDCKTEVEVLEKFVEVAKRLVPDKVSYTSFNGQLMELNRKELFEMYYLLPKMRDSWCETLEELFSFYGLDVDSLVYEEEQEVLC